MQKFNALNFYTKSSVQKFNALNFWAKVQCKSSMHWTFGQKFNAKVHCTELLGKSSMHWTFMLKVQCKSSMHWSFALNFFTKSSMQKFNAPNFFTKSSMQKFNALKFRAKKCKNSMLWTLNFHTKSSMQKFNALNFRAEVLHWSFGSKVDCTASFLRWNPRSKKNVWNSGSGLIFARFPWWNFEALKVGGELRIKLYRQKKPPTVTSWPTTQRSLQPWRLPPDKPHTSKQKKNNDWGCSVFIFFK